MEITLPPGIQKLVDDRIQSGRYSSAQEVISAALVMMDQEDRLLAMDAPQDTVSVQRKIEQGLEDARAGRLVDGEAFFDNLARRHETGKRNRRSA